MVRAEPGAQRQRAESDPALSRYPWPLGWCYLGPDCPVSAPQQEIVCRECGRRFRRYSSMQAQYCSVACSRKAKAPRARDCKRCGKSFVPPNPGQLGTGKFCSRVCWRGDVVDNQRRRVVLTCSTCGKTFERVAAWHRKNGRNVYCSRPCQSWGRVRPGSTHSRGPGWRKLAEEIRVRDGRRCVRCREPEPPGRRHAVDHIVPWLMLKDDLEVANDPANLATLCAPCHGIKTSVIEPRLMRGDLLALQEFYGRRIMEAATQRLPALAHELGLVRRSGE